MKSIVLGNGSSLKKHLNRGDFELFKKLDTFAMNRIDGLYESHTEYGIIGTDWRPTYWVWVEFIGGNYPSPEYIDRMYEYHIEPQIEKCFIGTRFYQAMVNRHPDAEHMVEWVDRCYDENHGRQYPHVDRPRSWHLPTHCIYGGTMNTVLSLAFQMGYSVGLVGCDLGIIKPSTNHDHNSFRPDYMTDIDGDWNKHNATLVDMHKLVKKEFYKAGRRIVNCGIGGALEVYDRVELKYWL